MQETMLRQTTIISLLIAFANSPTAEETVTESNVAGENILEELRATTTDNPNFGLFERYNLDVNAIWSTLVKGIANTNFCTTNIFKIGKTVVLYDFLQRQL